MAMHRATFLDMGAYDVGMDVWGGENVELPIRVCASILPIELKYTTETKYQDM